MSQYRSGLFPKDAFAALSALIFIWMYGLGTPDAFNAVQPFNSDRWKVSDLSGKTRCGMVADLQHRVGIVGKTRTEIEDLLGRPEHEDDPAGITHYHLCPSFMDIYILEMEWKNERVVSVDVRDT